MMTWTGPNLLANLFTNLFPNLLANLFASLLALGLATPLLAAPPEGSPRPQPRPGIDTVPPIVIMAAGVETSPIPQLRPQSGPQAAPPTSNPDFAAWIARFQTSARRAGIAQATLDQAFAGIALNQRVLERDRNQSEFTRALWDYLDSAVSADRIRTGQTALREHRATLAAIETRYGVEAEVITAIWGLESTYGTLRGNTAIIEAMATLAYDGRRRGFFETQLLAALRIVQVGDVAPQQMTGSWAGAMGHTQFMPTSYLAHAVDGDGDGRRDIWGDDPVDALASAANYLRAHGWTHGQPWGMEVVLPDGFDFAQTGERIKHPASHWNGLGVRLTDGGAVPDHGPASILLPAGAEGVALVIFDNFHVLERYNPADAYVIAVGHLSDRITGADGFAASWPRGDRALSFAERQELQRLLIAAGFSPGRIDGIVGPNTIDAVRRYQASVGLVPDGYAPLAILERLR